MQATEAAMHFSLYPAPIFQGWVRLVLHTALPASFLAHLPVDVSRNFDVTRLAAVAAFTAFIWAQALWAFRTGLRRYESGNLVSLRG